MTISTNDTRDEYTATSGQTVFSYTFKIFESTDLNVYVTPVGQVPNDVDDIVTGYAVTGIGSENGGTITLVTPANAGELVTIVSDIPESRTTDYQNNGDFLPTTVNDDFDRVVSLSKQTSDRASRTLVFQQSQQDVTDLELPTPESGKYLRWKTDLSGMENVDITAAGTGYLTPSPVRTTLTGDATFIYNGNFQIVLLLDPNGADRTVTPTGSFPDGFEVVVVNIGTSYLLNFDPSGIANSISPGDKQRFTYLLTEDEWV
jgi:hypothetical protein